MHMPCHAHATRVPLRSALLPHSALGEMGRVRGARWGWSGKMPTQDMSHDQYTASHRERTANLW